LKDEASKLKTTIGELVTSMYRDWMARGRPDLRTMIVPKRKLEDPISSPKNGVDPYMCPPFWAQKGTDDGT